MAQTAPFDFNLAVDRMYSAVTDANGELQPIDRMEFEVLDGGGLRWSLWVDGRRIYSASGQADDADGFLAATKIMLAMRSKQEKDHG